VPIPAAQVPADLSLFSSRVTGRMRELARSLTEPLRSPVLALTERPGKRLRSSLLGACAAFGSAGQQQRLARLGAVVELMHLASLLHDDVVDRAATRRGLPAAHAVLGDEGAMLAGLACFSLAGMEAAELGPGVARPAARAAASLAEGEMLDTERAFDIALPMTDYLDLIRHKTGDLFRLACLLGAAEAGSCASVAAALADFGAAFGLAFQILDDCLDLEPQGSGKPGGTDHVLGLFGAPTLHALRADADGELAALLLSPGFSERDLPAVRELVRARGGPDAAVALARKHHDAAVSCLDGLPEVPRAGLLAVAESAWQGAA
jgi:geranylgeranyl pyrophosphate synthase